MVCSRLPARNGCPPPPSLYNHHRRRALENLLVGNPAVGVDFGDDAGHAGEGLGEEQAARAVLVRERSVTRTSGDEDDFFVGRFGSEGYREKTDG